MATNSERWFLRRGLGGKSDTARPLEDEAAKRRLLQVRNTTHRDGCRASEPRGAAILSAGSGGQYAKKGRICDFARSPALVPICFLGVLFDLVNYFPRRKSM